jgi:hemerythrin-like metal-binding protein
MSPELMLAIPVVDYQHEKILQFIDGLKHRAATRPEVIQAIDDYTGRHFVVEEELMLAHGYPDFQRHKAEHDFLKWKIGGLLDAMGKDEIAGSKAIAEYMEAWLHQHIRTTDRPMTEFLKQRGVQAPA